MGIAYRCDPVLRCTFIVWHDDVTPDEWHRHIDTLFADPAFPPGPLILTDLRTAGGIPSITTEFISQIGTRINAEGHRLDGMKFAIVPNGAWDKARQFVDRDVSVPGLNAIVFAMSSSAYAWLGLGADDAEPVVDELRTRLRDEAP